MIEALLNFPWKIQLGLIWIVLTLLGVWLANNMLNDAWRNKTWCMFIGCFNIFALLLNLLSATVMIVDYSQEQYQDELFTQELQRESIPY
ncbi:hypothetical protein MZD04_gp324 [Pseudomonas phage Psa21]|uniref:Uncharacterized protein n=1 Tax=Pseudomonas phage Psa21 TaxID=2530023 RepID=A0A481W4V5_9CAUD|nr:hypothetical protein MZD04_gp324 [Pseudomonas phage Psa21]QBJ02850.1 hypothetical protein PSA21_324 [Pseudomonas phage Psa21]